jgi:limonene-1,2-epoxide hydrolase
MNMTDDIELVRSFVAAWNARSVDDIMAMMAPDIFYHNMPLEPLSGTAAARAVIERVCADSSEINWVITHIAATGNGVVLTERVDNFIMAGRPVSLPVMGAFRCAGGLIREWRDYFDLATYQRQIT